MNAEDTVMRAVTEGWFSVREDGTIWRVAQRRKTRDGVVTVEQLETPRTAIVCRTLSCSLERRTRDTWCECCAVVGEEEHGDASN